MIPGTPTRVPAVLGKLEAVARANEAFADVGIYQGPPINDPDELNVLVIAPSTPEVAGVTVTYAQEPGLGNAYVERVETLLTISCWSGDDDSVSAEAVRDRVLALYGALWADLRAQEAVAGVWDRIALGEGAEWYFIPAVSGLTVAVGFSVVSAAII